METKEMIETSQRRPPFQENVAIGNTAEEEDLLPPLFLSRERVIRRIRTDFDKEKFLAVDLDVSRLTLVKHRLWLAGRMIQSKPLYHQQMLQRRIIPTDLAELHMVFRDDYIFIKPLPRYLLNWNFWNTEICRTEELYPMALGLLWSYLTILPSRLDFNIAKQFSLLPADVTWKQWCDFSASALDHFDQHHLQLSMSVRYRFGDLDLARLNKIFRFAPEFRGRYLWPGFFPCYSEVTGYFYRNFGWILTALVFITTVLTALQVGLATSHMSGAPAYEDFAWGFSIFSILLPVAVLVLIVAFYFALQIFRVSVNIVNGQPKLHEKNPTV